VFSEGEEDTNEGGAVMALLASYYGTQPSTDSAGAAAAKDNPLDLDAPSFDAQAYAKVCAANALPSIAGIETGKWLIC
jgi:hypothetical protein